MDYEIPPHEIPESYEQRPPFSADWLYTPVFLSSSKELWILEFLIIANDRPIIDSERACSRGAGPNPFRWETTSCSIASLRRPPRGVVDFCMSENSGRTGWLEHHFILSGCRPRVDSTTSLSVLAAEKTYRMNLQICIGWLELVDVC